MVVCEVHPLVISCLSGTPIMQRTHWLKFFVLTGLILAPYTARPNASQGPLAAFYRSVQEALATNHQIKQAEARFSAALTLYAQARSAVLPTLSLAWSSNYTHTQWRGGRTQYDPTSLTLSVSQPLFNLSAIRGMKMVDPQVKALERDLEAIRQQVYFSLIQVATALLEAREVTRLARNHLDGTKSHLDATRARFAVGEVTKTDISQAMARVATAEAEWIRRRGEGDVNEARFREIAGIAVPDALQLPLVVSDLPTETLTRLTPLVMDRPDLQAARHRLQAEQWQIGVSQADHYPTLSLSSSGTRTWDPSSSSVIGPSDQFSLTVSASLPLYSGGLTMAKTRQAKSNRDLKQADLDLLSEQAMRELKEILSQYTSAKATDEALKTAVSAAQDAKEGVEQEYHVGSRTSLDLLDAQNELFSAQTDQVKSQYAVNLAHFQLLKVVGRLTPEGEGFQLVSQEEEGEYPVKPMRHEEPDSTQIGFEEETILPPQVVTHRTGWTIQTAALLDKQGAEQLLDRLNGQGGDLFIQRRVDKKGATWFLIRSGRYPNKAEALEAQKVFTKRFHRDAFVTTLETRDTESR